MDPPGWNENAFINFRENAKIMQKWANFREISQNFVSRKFFNSPLYASCGPIELVLSAALLL
jgi:hypothetical protein